MNLKLAGGKVFQIDVRKVQARARTFYRSRGTSGEWTYFTFIFARASCARNLPWRQVTRAKGIQTCSKMVVTISHSWCRSLDSNSQWTWGKCPCGFPVLCPGISRPVEGSWRLAGRPSLIPHIKSKQRILGCDTASKKKRGETDTSSFPKRPDLRRRFWAPCAWGSTGRYGTCCRPSWKSKHLTMRPYSKNRTTTNKAKVSDVSIIWSTSMYVSKIRLFNQKIIFTF